jgi:hypothetical protein
MVMTYLTAIVSMTVLMCCWLLVQRLWRRQFPEQASADGDALANRSGCHGCNCGPSRCQAENIVPNEITTEVTPHAP